MPSRVYLLYSMGKVISILPESRLFSLKAFLYRKLGKIGIDPTARIYSSVRIHTYPVTIGARTHIGSRVLFGGANGCPIEIGNDCDIAPEVAFMTGTHEIGSPTRRAGIGKAYPIIVGNGTWIGTRSLILPGVEIGEGCVIAAGSVVTKNIPSNCLAAGIPAVIKRNLTSELQ